MAGQEEVTEDSGQQEVRKDPVDYESRPMYVAGTDENHKLVRQDLYKSTDTIPPVIAFPQEYCGGHCELPLITLPDTPGRISEYRIRAHLLLVAKDVEKAGNLAQLDAWYIREFIAADGHATAKTKKTEPKSEKQAKCDRHERMWATVTDPSRLQAINSYPPLMLVFRTMQHQEICLLYTSPSPRDLG